MHNYLFVSCFKALSLSIVRNTLVPLRSRLSGRIDLASCRTFLHKVQLLLHLLWQEQCWLTGKLWTGVNLYFSKSKLLLGLRWICYNTKPLSSNVVLLYKQHWNWGQFVYLIKIIISVWAHSLSCPNASGISSQCGKKGKAINTRLHRFVSDPLSGFLYTAFFQWKEQPTHITCKIG